MQTDRARRLLQAYIPVGDSSKSFNVQKVFESPAAIAGVAPLGHYQLAMHSEFWRFGFSGTVSVMFKPAEGLGKSTISNLRSSKRHQCVAGMAEPDAFGEIGASQTVC